MTVLQPSTLCIDGGVEIETNDDGSIDAVVGGQDMCLQEMERTQTIGDELRPGMYDSDEYLYIRIEAEGPYLDVDEIMIRGKNGGVTYHVTMEECTGSYTQTGRWVGTANYYVDGIVVTIVDEDDEQSVVPEQSKELSQYLSNVE